MSIQISHPVLHTGGQGLNSWVLLFLLLEMALTSSSGREIARYLLIVVRKSRNTDFFRDGKIEETLFPFFTTDVCISNQEFYCHYQTNFILCKIIYYSSNCNRNVYFPSLVVIINEEVESWKQTYSERILSDPRVPLASRPQGVF